MGRIYVDFNMPVAMLILDLLLYVITLIFIAVRALERHTDEYILKYSGAYYVTIGTVELLFTILSLIAPLIISRETAAEIVPMLIRFLFSIMKLAIGIIIYKLKYRFSALSFIIACFGGGLSAINLIVDQSFASKLTFAVILVAIVAMLRQFRDKRKHSK